MEVPKEPTTYKDIAALILVVICLIVFVGGFVWFHYSSIYDVWEYNALEDRGLLIEATVTDYNYSPAGSRTMESRTLDYEYTINGITYAKSKSVDRGGFSQGQKINIMYLPENHKVSNLQGNTAFVQDLALIIIVDIILFICIIVIYIQHRKEKKLEAKKDSVEESGVLDDMDI